PTTAFSAAPRHTSPANPGSVVSKRTRGPAACWSATTRRSKRTPTCSRCWRTSASSPARRSVRWARSSPARATARPRRRSSARCFSRARGRTVDLKLLFRVALGAVGLRQFFTAGLGIAEVPAYVLLWYAFDAFYKLHQAPAVESTESRRAPEARAATDQAMVQ